jgi:hypothetical protein
MKPRLDSGDLLHSRFAERRRHGFAGALEEGRIGEEPERVRVAVVVPEPRDELVVHYAGTASRAIRSSSALRSST